VNAGAPWWAGAVGYEVYLPSFQDGNGDGWGDLPGLSSRLDYLRDLGVDLIWVTPFYPSPMKDHGYDVADYLSVDPRFGTLEDVDRLLGQAHRRGIRVIADLVVNHTSDQHAWFASARRSRASRWRDYYVWRDPRPAGGPPNNWLSHFGGPAWTYDRATGQYYLHLFTPHQPDLNWANPAVADEVDAIIGFWLERGLDGFRVDTAHYLAKHPGLPDNPLLADEEVPRLGGVTADWLHQDHRHDIGQATALDIHQRWRALADKNDALLVGEVYVLDPARLATYIDGRGLHSAFFFGLVESAWRPRHVGRMLADAAAASPHLSWVQSSHDRPRAVTRYGGGPQGWRRWLALSVLLAALPGPMFLYQGEELGLADGFVLAGCDPDPLAVAGGLSRAGCRTPMPWEPAPAVGFTPAAQAWLPSGQRAGHETAAVQAADPASPLTATRRLIAAHRALDIGLEEPISWLETGLLVAYRRGHVLAAANLGDAPAALDPGPGNWQIVFDTGNLPSGTSGKGCLTLTPEQAVLAVRRPSSPEGAHHA
jgi:alpha-glucosidase